MTTIVALKTKDQIILAADRRTSRGDLILNDCTTKLIVENTYAAAFSGYTVNSFLFVNALKKKLTPKEIYKECKDVGLTDDEISCTQGIVLDLDEGKLYAYEGTVATPIEGAYYAVGSGSREALGAMFMSSKGWTLDDRLRDIYTVVFQIDPWTSAAFDAIIYSIEDKNIESLKI